MFHFIQCFFFFFFFLPHCSYSLILHPKGPTRIWFTAFHSEGICLSPPPVSIILHFIDNSANGLYKKVYSILAILYCISNLWWLSLADCSGPIYRSRGLTRRPADIPPIDPTVLLDLQRHTQEVAHSVEVMMRSLNGTIQNVSLSSSFFKSPCLCCRLSQKCNTYTSLKSVYYVVV